MDKLDGRCKTIVGNWYCLVGRVHNMATCQDPTKVGSQVTWLVGFGRSNINMSRHCKPGWSEI